MAAVATAERGLIVYQLENQPSEFRRIESPLKHQVKSYIWYRCICTDCWNYVLAVLDVKKKKTTNYFKGGVLSFGMARVLLWLLWWYIKINCHPLHLGVCFLPVMGLQGLKGISWNALRVQQKCSEITFFLVLHPAFHIWSSLYVKYK